MTKTTLPLYALLISTVSSVDGSPKSLEDAKFAAKLAANGEIPADKLPEVASAIDQQLGMIAGGDGIHVCEAHQMLMQARASISGQVDFYKQQLDMFDDDNQLSLGIDNKLGAAASIMPTAGMIRDGAVHHPAE